MARDFPSMTTREELRRLCDGDLSKHLQALEAERAGARRAWTGFGVSAILAVGIAFVMSRMDLSLEGGAFAFLVIVVPPLYMFSRRAGEAGSRRAVAFRDLIGDLAARVLPGSSYGRPRGSASIFETVQASGLFNERAQECDTIAAVSGAAHPAGLVFAEVRLYSVKEWNDPRYGTPTGRVGAVDVNRRKESDVFRGLFLAFDLGATIRGTTFADPKRVGVAIAARDALEPVAFEDPAFERVYRVTSSDPEEARALLPPSARAGLLRLREMAKQPVHLSISDNRVSVAIEFGRQLFVLGSRAVDFERVVEIAELFGLAEAAAAALPLRVSVATSGRAEAGRPASAASEAERAPGRPATSKTRLTRRAEGLGIVYTRAVSRLALSLSALFAPLLAWFWFLAAQELLGPSTDKTGVFAAMIPLSLASVGWLFAAQAWWGPVRRVEVDAGELRVTRGLLRRTRVPAASVRALAVRGGVLHADDLAISPDLPGAELQWLAYEVGRVLPSTARD